MCCWANSRRLLKQAAHIDHSNVAGLIGDMQAMEMIVLDFGEVARRVGALP